METLLLFLRSFVIKGRAGRLTELLNERHHSTCASLWKRHAIIRQDVRLVKGGESFSADDKYCTDKEGFQLVAPNVLAKRDFTATGISSVDSALCFILHKAVTQVS